MIIGDYVVRCPNCSTEIRVVAEMVSPLILYCHGCNQSLILGNNVIFNLPFDFISKLAEEHGIRHCGNVLGTLVSDAAKELINDNKLNELHNLLEQSIDVQDFIKKIK